MQLLHRKNHRTKNSRPMNKKKVERLQTLIKENPFLPPTAYFTGIINDSVDTAEIFTSVRTAVSKKLNTKSLILNSPYKHISKIY